MKGSKIKILTIILVVVLIVMVSFLGVYTKVQNRMEDQVKDYVFAMDLEGGRNVELTIDTSTKDVIKDSEGKEVKDSENLTDDEIKEKGYTKESVKVNEDSALTKENYQECKNIIDKRLKLMGVQEYITRLDEETGNIFVEVGENTGTDDVVSNLTTVSKFVVESESTGEVLMDNSDIEGVNVLYGNPNSDSVANSGTAVYLNIQFNSAGTAKLKDISSKYKDATKESDDGNNTSDENTTSNESTTENTTENTTETSEVDETGEEQPETLGNVVMKVDDQEILTTNFEKVIENGTLQLMYGQATTDEEEFQSNITKANNMAMLLRNEVMPIKYNVQENRFIESEFKVDDLKQIAIIFVAVMAVLLLLLIFKFKLNGLLVAISYVGIVGLIPLMIRLANVVISMEGAVAVGLALIINYAFICYLLCELKQKENAKEAIKETYKRFLGLTFPAMIMGVVLSFMEWQPLNSFGMVMFWGFMIIVVYNYVITGTLIKQVDGNVGGDSNEE